MFPGYFNSPSVVPLYHTSNIFEPSTLAIYFKLMVEHVSMCGNGILHIILGRRGMAGMQGQVVGCKRDRPASLLTHNPFQSCITEQPDLLCWRSDVNRPEAGKDAPLPGHQSKRMRSSPADDQEDVAESMPWGPAEALAVPDARQSIRSTVRSRDHSSQSAASSHWQVQVWPQPTFKLHRDVLEDDATSPYSASCSEEN